MRAAWLSLAACAAPAPSAPKPKHTVVVLGLEAIPDDDATRAAAGALTDELRTGAGAPSSKFRLVPRTETLAEMRELASCPRPAAACMAEIGAFLDVDYLIYGKLDHGELAIDLMDVQKRFNRRTARVRVAPGAARAALAQLGD